MMMQPEMLYVLHTQGYRALLAWRDAAGREFDIRQLVDVLRSCDMEDVADVAISLLEGE